MEQAVYSIGHACLEDPRRTTSYSAMSAELLQASAIDVRGRGNMWDSRQQGWVAWVDMTGAPTAQRSSHFTLTPAGWAKFEELRDVGLEEMLAITCARESNRHRR